MLGIPGELLREAWLIDVCSPAMQYLLNDITGIRRRCRRGVIARNAMIDRWSRHRAALVESPLESEGTRKRRKHAEIEEVCRADGGHC